MRSQPTAMRGVPWMGGAVFSFSAMAVAARELLRHMGTFEVLFMRTGISFLILLAFLPRSMRTAPASPAARLPEIRV